MGDHLGEYYIIGFKKRGIRNLGKSSCGLSLRFFRDSGCFRV